ncbi:MAG: type II secretion system F family protein [Nitrospirae bacterium]|nr:type II secretion system F family protein [Nitrospirota bacterium]
MAKFAWEGRTVQGQMTTGSMEAPSAEVARDLLGRRRIEVTKITAEESAFAALKNIKLFQGSVTGKDLAVFTRQISTMIDAGVPILQALEIMGAQTPNKYFRGVITAVKADVSAGATFAQSLKRHPRVFDHLYVNLVASGEQSGALPTVLTRLAIQIEKMVKLKSMVKKAMMYPAVVVFVAVGVMTLMLVYVIPKFEGIFEGLGGKLPPLTQAVIGLSHFLIDHFVLFGAAAGGAVFAFILGLRNEKFRKEVHRILLRMPIFGTIIRKIALARFARTLGTMVTGGLPIMDSLEIVSKASGNLIVQASVMKLRDELSKGKTLSEPMFKDKLFPPMVAQMVQVGENTGQLESMLGKIADYYEEEVDVTVAGLTSILEPLLIVFLGATVGVIIVAMYLPIFKIGELV